MHLMPTNPVLHVLSVHPDYWRQGIGTMLVESGIREIDKIGLDLDIFVRAKKAGLGVYKRIGFNLMDQIVQDASKYGIKEEYGAYFLVREGNRDNAALQV
jgi:ribosomal protein S18 acetylase RimI-like enzyme